MYLLSTAQRNSQGQRLKNVHLRLVVGYLKTALYWLAEHPSGPLPFVVEGHRSFDAQAANYAKGRTAPGPIVTNKVPGTSLHERSPSLALDIGFLDDHGQPLYEDELYREFYRMWREHDPQITWGGLWISPHDGPHFEIPPDPKY